MLKKKRVKVFDGPFVTSTAGHWRLDAEGVDSILYLLNSIFNGYADTSRDKMEATRHDQIAHLKLRPDGSVEDVVGTGIGTDALHLLVKEGLVLPWRTATDNLKQKKTASF